MNSRACGIIISAVAICVVPSALRARETYSDQPRESAVDLKNVRHYESDYPGHHVPWRDDQLQAYGPEYPYADRVQHHQGDGLFCVALDPQTGFVSQIIVLKSTGFSTLDSSAIASLRHWRWKPGRWKEINIPVTFQLTHGPPQLKPEYKWLRLPPLR